MPITICATPANRLFSYDVMKAFTAQDYMTAATDMPEIQAITWKRDLSGLEVIVAAELAVKLVVRGSQYFIDLDGAIGNVTHIDKTPYAEWSLTVDCREWAKAHGILAPTGVRHVYVSDLRKVELDMLAILPEQEPEISNDPRAVFHHLVNYRTLWARVDDLIDSFIPKFTLIEERLTHAS